MATLRGEVYSRVLRMDTGITVITPRKPTELEGKPKVVYLLHGITENSSTWANNVGLALLAQEYNVIFILPEVQRSFYVDMKYGLRYFSYINMELSGIVSRLFNVSSLREDTMIMGLSMGGYGALKCAFSNPELYAYCGAFSAACDIKSIYYGYKDDVESGFSGELLAGFGLEGELLEENCLYNLSTKCSQGDIKPKIFMTSGSDDWLHQMSEDFNKHMASLDFDYTYEVWQGGHDWKFWEKSLKLALDKFTKE